MRRARQDGVKRREALLNAALRCFVERGLLATGIEDIRKAAGASPSSMYHLFGGLADITLTLLVRTFRRLFEHLAARVLPTTSADAAVRALVDAYLEWVLKHRDEAHFMYQAMAALELSAEQRRTLAEEKSGLWKPVLDHLLAQFAASAALARWSPLSLEVVLLGPTHEACRRYLAGAELDVDWMRTTLPELAWTALTAADRASPVSARA
jgi:AcrR family transcriptional regulator